MAFDAKRKMNPGGDDIDVSADFADDEGRRVIALKIQSGSGFEINIKIDEGDVSKLREIPNTDWDSRETLLIGESLGESVFWCVDDERISILIGHDDETWEIGFWIPFSMLDELVSECENPKKQA